MTYDKEAWRASVQNGRIPAEKLAPVFPTQYDPDLQGPAIMHPEAAEAMSALLAYAYADGVTELKVKYSYRTIAKQWEKWEDYQNGGNLAAYPGTSNHGWAVSVDFTGLTARALQWLANNARDFGFINDVPSENWHYTYQEGGVRPRVLKFREERMYSDFEKGYKARMAGKPEPTQDGPERFGWRAADWAAARPLAGAHDHNIYARANHDHPAGAHTHSVTGTAS